MKHIFIFMTYFLLFFFFFVTEILPALEFLSLWTVTNLELHTDP